MTSVSVQPAKSWMLSIRGVLARGTVFFTWAGLFRSQVFRIVVIYVVLFGLSATGLIAFTYWNAKRALEAQSDQLIEAEIADLANQYRQLDEDGLELLIMNRSGPGARGLYLLADPSRRVIAG